MVTTKNEKESVLLMVGVLYSILSNIIYIFERLILPFRYITIGEFLQRKAGK